MPPAAYFDEKARTPIRSMTIVDLKFHAGELFVAGVSNQEFSSTLRRIPYPFTGNASETQVEIYHVAHGVYETRAPIRTCSSPPSTARTRSSPPTPAVLSSLFRSRS